MVLPASSPLNSRVTAAEVAARAGTSASSVSLVVNGKAEGRVSEALAQRIRTAVDELGYVVDHSASALAKGYGDLVIMVAPDMWNPYFSEMIGAIRDALGGRYQLLLSVTDRGKLPSYKEIHQFSGLRPAGFLIDAPDDSFAGGFPLPSPTVFLDAPEIGRAGNVINYDYGGAIEDLSNQLQKRGHKNVAYLNGDTEAGTFQLRLNLLRQALHKRNIELLPEITAAPVDIEQACSVVLHKMPKWQKQGVTAIVCAADILAYGALLAAKHLRIEVPKDLAIVGFDDLTFSTITDPSLTSISLPGDVLGRRAAELLIRQIEKLPELPEENIQAILVNRGSL